MTNVAEVLAAHDPARVLTAQNPDTWRCACGWIGSGRNHITHVAEQIQPLIDAEKQRAVEEALDEAADRLWREGERQTHRRSYPAGVAWKEAASVVREVRREARRPASIEGGS